MYKEKLDAINHDPLGILVLRNLPLVHLNGNLIDEVFATRQKKYEEMGDRAMLTPYCIKMSVKFNANIIEKLPRDIKCPEAAFQFKKKKILNFIDIADFPLLNLKLNNYLSA